MYRYNGPNFLYGVPARDLTEDEWNALSEKQRQLLKPAYERVSRQKTERQAKASLTVEVAPTLDTKATNRHSTPSKKQE